MLRKLPLLVLTLTLLASAVLLGALAQDADKVEFKVVPTGLQLPDGFQFAGITAMAHDKDDNLHLYHRGKSSIVVFSKDGKFLRTWGDDNTKTSHGLRIDRHGNVWTTDIGNHLVIKYDPVGKVLLTLGTKDKPGESKTQFNMPADIAFGPNDDVYVADGYRNTRVVRFSKTGEYLGEWGTKGKEPGQFNLPHAIFFDGKDRLFVGDRENSRIQVFDLDGKFITQWKNLGKPYGVFMPGMGRVFVADGTGNQVHLMGPDGKTLVRWGMKGMEAGEFSLPHGICVDSQGNVFVSEVAGKRLQKFVPKRS